MFTNLSAGAIGIRDASLAETLLLARAGGFHGIDFAIAEAAILADQRGVDYVRGLFDAAGVKPGQWGLPFDWRDDAKYQAGLAALPKLAALGADLGCLRCATWMPSFSDERDFAANFGWHVARYRPIAQILKDNGVAFGIEFLGPETIRRGHKYEFIHSLDGLFELAAAIGTGNVGLLLDAWHLYTDGGSMSEVRKLKPEQVVTVHVNDAPAGVPLAEQLDQVRALPGETGVIPLGEFLRALVDIGYAGPVTVEPFSKRLNAMAPFDAVRATAAALKSVWP
jgi:sugar phosphate isomerase/epimerase